MNRVTEDTPSVALDEAEQGIAGSEVLAETDDSSESEASDDSGQSVGSLESGDSDLEGSGGSAESGVEEGGDTPPIIVLRNGQLVSFEQRGGHRQTQPVICFVVEQCDDRQCDSPPSWILIFTGDTQCEVGAIVYHEEKCSEAQNEIGSIEYVEKPFAFVKLYPNTFRQKAVSIEKLEYGCSPESNQALQLANRWRLYKDHAWDDVVKSLGKNDLPVKAACKSLEMLSFPVEVAAVNLRPGALVAPYMENRSPQLKECGVLYEVLREKDGATYFDLLPLFKPLCDFINRHICCEVRVELPLMPDALPASPPAATATPQSTEASRNVDSGVGTSVLRSSSLTVRQPRPKVTFYFRSSPI